MNFNFTENQLAQLIPGNNNISEWWAAMCDILPRYEINTIERVAAFIAQCAHESNNFRFLQENLNYSAEGLMRTWPSRFTSLEFANRYARQPEKIANLAYANRMGNGPESSGDGWRYRGQGLIQLTGKTNQERFAESVGLTLDDMENFLGTYTGAIESACWFWQTNNLNHLSDIGDIDRISRVINGGTHGIDDRRNRYKQALDVLSDSNYESTVVESTDWQTVRLGSRGNTVALVQRALGLTDDGIFGNQTERALIEWQRSNNLAADGIAGPQTLKKLLG
jgi:putative chitinase